MGSGWCAGQLGVPEWHKRPLCTGSWKEGAHLPLQEQLHGVHTAVHRWERETKHRVNLYFHATVCLR